MEKSIILGIIGFIVLIIVLLLIIRATRPQPAVVIGTPSPVALASPTPTPTKSPGSTENPVIMPQGNQPGKIIGVITTKVPFDKPNFYLLTVETPNFQNFDVAVLANVPVYDQNGKSVGNGFLAVGQIVEVSVVPAETDFTAQSINIINGS